MPHLMPKTCRIKKIFDTARDTKTFILDIKDFGSRPGQFANFWLAGIDEKPFSIAKDTGEEVWITICKVGPFTEKVFELKEGDLVGLRGPFGKGFTFLENKNVVFVAGGFGAAPLHFLGEEQKKRGCNVHALIGARSNDLLVFKNECEESGFNTLVSTNDGTCGKEGFITDILEELLQKEDIDMIQCCGPEMMMKRVAEIAKEYVIPCEISVERYMKCGFGICGQCVLNGKRMCIDGPVVNAEFALAQPDFGVFKRGSEGQKIYFNK